MGCACACGCVGGGGRAGGRACSGLACTTAGSTNLKAGNTAWLHTNFAPTSCADGTTYVFRGVSCSIKTTGGQTSTVACPDSEVTFSKSCTTASTTYDSTQKCWVTTLPASSIASFIT